MWGQMESGVNSEVRKQDTEDLARSSSPKDKSTIANNLKTRLLFSAFQMEENYSP